ncbi:Hypothetical predicted protein [Mytilus galloprovincialis]|uniref:Uncharacterized protein n=1 Tax=Mytilus galloprovincialis TaxID=29158 RepID=A0A8B6H603_MYTGA|nr:Hypothetical predicted protein [Mytilus galloprovincialis]
MHTHDRHDFTKKDVAKKLAISTVLQELLYNTPTEESKDPKETELEKPPPDPLYGLRIHSWVLVLSGKREVPESFFIEPFTGLSHPVNSPNYLGIESVWNHVNYWVNMQDCSEGVKGLTYDLGDCTKWEYMFPSIDKPLKIPGEDGFEDFEDEESDGVIGDEDEDEENDAKKLEHLDMPPSWVEIIKLSLKDFQMRCPHGKKVKLYKRAKLEKFAHYLMKDGLISKLSIYENRELTDLVTVKEYFAHRIDKLLQRVSNHRSGWVTEHFDPGRSHCLKEHQYKSSAPGPENERTMIFYNEARVDGLIKRVETPAEMMEEYSDRDDFLYYKHIDFGKRPKKFGPQDGSSSKNERPIVKMVKKFNRNVSKPACDDVAELIYLVSEDKMQITYHTEDPRIAASTREFVKPANWAEKGATLQFSPDMQQAFQVDASSRQNKQVELYQMLLNLLKSEDLCRTRVRDSEDEVKDILNERTKEETTLELDISVYDTERNEKAKKHRRELVSTETTLELDISVYDTERNEKAKKHRRELERQQLEEKMRKQDMEIDYLAPFIARIVQGDKITREEAYTLKTEALKDLKDRLINKANLIQARYEKETQMLTEKQAWYHQNQLSCNKEDEEKYMTFCQETLFKIHMLELRLARHKETAPHKYMALDRRLRDDQRLAEYF